MRKKQQEMLARRMEKLSMGEGEEGEEDDSGSDDEAQQEAEGQRAGVREGEEASEEASEGGEERYAAALHAYQQEQERLQQVRIDAFCTHSTGYAGIYTVFVLFVCKGEGRST
jgi:hypothetical protein